MKRLIECVPNFSEGRDAAKLDAVVAAMLAVPGVFLLDREADADHNRSVVTLAGEPEAVKEAAVRGVARAAELIDLTAHQGAHPRIGATDVVPFVPVANVTIEECVALAQEAGREIWERCRVPVYFYEAAAKRPGRANLENIRRGQFEGLREEAPRNPDRAPDIGGPALHPTAGATVVGARKFLIAYNINLQTADAEIAKRIARSIRFSSGGLRYVKAMGLALGARNLAQVSINLTDFEQTPLHRVFEIVKREAERYGAAIAGSEIVGLVPKRAFEIAADFYLQLENFSPAQVLENRLESALGGEATTDRLAALLQPLLQTIAEPTAAPGGGSAAALCGALAAALGQMVAGISRRKKSLAAHAERLGSMAAEFAALARALAEAADRDASAFESVLAAHRLPQGSPQEAAARQAAIGNALRGAAEVPLETARAAAQTFEKLRELEAISNPATRSDVRVGKLMAAAAVRGALENVEINLESLGDAALAAKFRAACEELTAIVSEAPGPAGVNWGKS